jgi:hypothetical protein
MIRNVMSATRRRGFLKATAYHMVSQRFVVQSPLLSRILWALFFGNRFLPALGRYASYADGSIDKDLKTIFQKKRSGFFVEIGSNDGVSGSNCKKLEMEQGWVGILVEPYLPNLNTSKLHRSRKNSFVHAAAVPADFGADTVELIFSNLMTLVDKPTSEISDPWRHALSGSEFLSIDIEGFELDVLSDLDFNNYKFQAIILENRNRQAAVEFFRPLGYSLFSQPSPLNLIFTPTPR